MILWWLDLQLHVYKDENKLRAVESRDRMVVGFTTTCILRREQVRERRDRMVVRFTATCI